MTIDVPKPVEEQTLIERLEWRATIREIIRPKGDRIAADLRAAVARIQELEEIVERLT